MPGQRRVQIIENALPGHIGLTGAALLGRAAEQHHRSGQLLFRKTVSEQESRFHRRRPQQRMAAAVSALAARDGLRLRRASLLREARKRVIFRQKTDHRLPASRSCRKGSRHIGHAFRDRKTLFPQKIADRRRGAGLLKFQFGRIPDAGIQCFQFFRIFSHGSVLSAVMAPAASIIPCAPAAFNAFSSLYISARMRYTEDAPKNGDGGDL